MIFQFDQCLNDKKLAREVQRQGLAEAWCDPRRLMDEEDPVVLSDLLAKPNPLVTLDLRMARDHSNYIPEESPGMVVISNGKSNPAIITTGAEGPDLVQEAIPRVAQDDVQQLDRRDLARGHRDLACGQSLGPRTMTTSPSARPTG